MRIKVCGIKTLVQATALSQLGVDYIGHIFYKASPRNMEATAFSISGAQRTGVFVDEPIESLLQKAEEWQLNCLQLHGHESVEYLNALKNKGYTLLKAFAIQQASDFQQTRAYQDYCDFFLFDTKGPAKGGNGFCFDWQLLEAYKGKKPYFLSGGIDLQHAQILRELSEKDPRLWAIDINSRFELQAGIKDLSKIKSFFALLKRYNCNTH